MRDMMAKFGKQVESFPYAFVLPNHDEGWEGNAFHARPAASAARVPLPAQDTATLRRRAGDKRPIYIEIKPA